MMKLEDALRMWALYLIHNGNVSAKELQAIKQQGESVQGGECTNKKTGAAIYDDSEVKKISRLIQELPEKQQDVLYIEYVDTGAATQAEACKLHCIAPMNYRKRLSRAKQILRVKGHYH